VITPHLRASRAGLHGADPVCRRSGRCRHGQHPGDGQEL